MIGNTIESSQGAKRCCRVHDERIRDESVDATEPAEQCGAHACGEECVEGWLDYAAWKARVVGVAR